jgi:hypothetical protein
MQKQSPQDQSNCRLPKSVKDAKSCKLSPEHNLFTGKLERVGAVGNGVTTNSVVPASLTQPATVITQL